MHLLPGHEIGSDRLRLHILASIALPVGEVCNLKARSGSWRDFAQNGQQKDMGARMSDLAVLDPRAAFVDVGSEKMHVSIAGGSPEVFGTVTSQLHALRDYLAKRPGSIGYRSMGFWKLRAWRWSWSMVAKRATFRDGRPT